MIGHDGKMWKKKKLGKYIFFKKRKKEKKERKNSSITNGALAWWVTSLMKNDLSMKAMKSPWSTTWEPTKANFNLVGQKTPILDFWTIFLVNWSFNILNKSSHKEETKRTYLNHVGLNILPLLSTLKWKVASKWLHFLFWMWW